MPKTDTKIQNGDSAKQKKVKPEVSVNKYDILTNKKRKLTETQTDQGKLEFSDMLINVNKFNQLKLLFKTVIR